MNNKSKNCSRKKKNQMSKVENRKTLAADVASQSIIEDSLILPTEMLSPELSPEAPSTSQNTSEKTIALLEPDEVVKIRENVKSLFEDHFQEKSEVVVKRDLLENIMSEALKDYFSSTQTSKSMEEVRYLKEKCRAFETKQIKLNRQSYALETYIEYSKKVINDMLDKRSLFQQGPLRKELPQEKQVRSVGLQVQLVGLPLSSICKTGVNYSTSITSQYTERILSPKELNKPEKDTVNKEVNVKKDEKASTSNINQSSNSRSPLEKETRSGNKSNIITRSMSKRNKMATEVECIKPKSPVKVKYEKKSNEDIKNAKQVTKANSKGFENVIPGPSKKEDHKTIIIKQEKSNEGAQKNPSGSKLNINTRRLSRRKRRIEEDDSREPYFKAFEDVIPRVIKKEEHKSIFIKKEKIYEGAQENPSGSKLNITTRRSHLEGKYIKISNDDDDVEIWEEKVEVIEISDDEDNPSGSNLNITTRRSQVKGKSINKFNDDDVEIRDEKAQVIEISDDEENPRESKLNITTRRSQVKGKSIKKFNEDEGKVLDDKVEVLDDEDKVLDDEVEIIEISDDEIINTTEVNEIGIQVNLNIDTDDNYLYTLPEYPLSSQYPSNVSKPPAPILNVEIKGNIGSQRTVMLTWHFACKVPENIVEYQLYSYSYKERNGRQISENAWHKVGDINAMPLPMVCYISEVFEDIKRIHFIIRAVDSQKLVGDFSNLAYINLQK